MKPPQKTLVVLVGATGVGKTALGIKLAQHLDTEIISADSRQVFREMNVGTAKPKPKEMQGIVHHFVDSHSITENFTVADFEKQALAVLEKIFEKKNVALVVGGSGLYVKVLCEGLDEMPETDPEIREKIQQQFDNQGLESLLEQLQVLDPVYARQVDTRNPQRIIRALEVCLSTGLPYSAFRTGKKTVRPFNILKIGINRPRPVLYQRIDDRMDLMLAAGLVEEAKSLYEFRHKNALQTVGYHEVFDFLEGKYDESEMIRLLKRNSRRYAKRQMTWFNKDLATVWFEAEEEEKILHFIENHFINSYPWVQSST
ncbi:MAG: tRNA (adenosine(37)-N6)-dimethylallyltransferase MiaA [Verrucomicrobia bacterium]|nr:tRNA (adenosine(37)-N6)-dimethylallyltransferase MiaA [Cytophagales bacterium]